MESTRTILESVRRRVRALLSSGKEVGMESIQGEFSFVISNVEVFRRLVMKQVFFCRNYPEFKRLMQQCGYCFLKPNVFVRGGGDEPWAFQASFREPEPRDAKRLERALDKLLERYADVEEAFEDVLFRLDKMDCVVERCMEAVRHAFDKGLSKSPPNFQEVAGLFTLLGQQEEALESVPSASENPPSPGESDVETLSESSSQEEEVQAVPTESGKRRQKGSSFF